MKHFNKTNENVQSLDLDVYECISMNVLGCISSFGKFKLIEELREKFILNSIEYKRKWKDVRWNP